MITRDDDRTRIRPYVPFPDPIAIPEYDPDSVATLALTLHAEWLPVFLGALEILDQPDLWIGTEEQIESARQYVREKMNQLSIGA